MQQRFIEYHCHKCQHKVIAREDLAPDHCLGCGSPDWLKKNRFCEECNYFEQMSIDAEYDKIVSGGAD